MTTKTQTCECGRKHRGRFALCGKCRAAALGTKQWTPKETK